MKVVVETARMAGPELRQRNSGEARKRHFGCIYLGRRRIQDSIDGSVVDGIVDDFGVDLFESLPVLARGNHSILKKWFNHITDLGLKGLLHLTMTRCGLLANDVPIPRPSGLVTGWPVIRPWWIGLLSPGSQEIYKIADNKPNCLIDNNLFSAASPNRYGGAVGL